MTVATRKVNQLADIGTLQAGDKIVGERTSGTTGLLTVGTLAISDGDKGDITVSDSGATWTIDTPAVATVATDDKILIKDTSASNVMKYVTAQSIADLAPAGYTDEQAQDAIGGMLDATLTYVDATPLLSRAALTGDVTAASGSNITVIANDAVTYAKMQNVSATDKLLGRSSALAGDVEEITCTAAGRALLDDIDASAQRTTLGLGTLATQSGTFSGTSSGTNTGDQNVAASALARIGASTYSTVQDLANLNASPGRTSGGVISDAGGATVNVTAGTGWIRATDSEVAEIKFFNWSASNGLAIASNTVRYVGVEYNSGTPQVVVRTTQNWDYDTDFPLGIVINEAGTLYILNAPWATGDATANIIERLDSTAFVTRDNRMGGLIIGNTGTRNVTVTAGALLSRLSEFLISAIDTSGAGRFDAYYRDGASGFTKVATQSQWNNSQYDDGDGTLANIAINRYSNRWFYICADGTLVMMYGQSDNISLATIQAESPPSTLPNRVQQTGILIGRIIAQQGTSTPAAVQTTFGATFAGNNVTDHGSLTGLTDDDHTQYLLADGSRTISSATLRTMLTDETGTGVAYFAGGALGTPSSGTLTNCTGYPGDWQLISTGTASNSATIDFTGLSSTYTAYKVLISNLLPATNTVEFLLRTSTDNGSSFSAGASDYSFVLQGTGASTVGGRNTGNGAIDLMDSTIFGTLTNVSTDETAWEITIFNPSATTEYHKVSWNGTFISGTSGAMIYGIGYRSADTAVNAVRFLMSSGNISTGVFKLYGIRA